MCADTFPRVATDRRNRLRLRSLRTGGYETYAAPRAFRPDEFLRSVIRRDSCVRVRSNKRLFLSCDFVNLDMVQLI